MKKTWFSILVKCLLLFSIASEAQQPADTRQDSLRPRRDSLSGKDTGRVRRGDGGSLFSDTTKLTSSDYQLEIERAYVVLNNIDNKSELGPQVNSIKTKLADNDSILSVLKDNVLNNARALSIRNLRVFQTLLQNVQRDLKGYRQLLDSSENMLNDLRSSLRTLRGDTVLMQLMRDSALRIQFAPQLKEMRETWRSGTRGLRRSLSVVNLLQTQVSSNSITTSRLLEKVNNLLNTSAARIFGKEYNYLWEKEVDTLGDSSRSSFRKAYFAERKALQYYFRDSSYKRVLLLLCGILFFAWIFRNVRILRRHNALGNLSTLDFEYLPRRYVVSALVIMLSIAPLFDLYAPSAYSESMQFLLVIILTIIFWRKLPRKLFFYWIAMTMLYVCFAFTHHISDPGFLQRSWLIALNILSIVFGLLFLSGLKDNLQLKGFLRFVIILHNVMNVLSIVFNVFGRFSIAQMLGNAAIFSFMQATGLAVFSKIFIESILLQIAASRAKRGMNAHFDYSQIINSFSRLILVLIVLLWLIVFANNLNVYNAALESVSNFLQTPRHVGNASFTMGGVLLFFMIIWIAHLLQKYVGYFFFGESGSDDDVQNKGQRSRLLITKLVLLCLGYLLAVAASGVPVDKITIVIGALGVGIGLGLQNIVNNFVSGIVLIFDRPLQIGDIVEVGGQTGRVKEIGLRSSTLLTNDGAEVVIPNGDILSQKIINWTLTNNQQRIEIDLSLSGSTDMEKVATVVKKAISSSKYIFENKEPQVLFTKVNEDGFDIKAFFWCVDVAKSELAKSEIVLLLHKHLEAEQIRVN